MNTSFPPEKKTRKNETHTRLQLNPKINGQEYLKTSEMRQSFYTAKTDKKTKQNIFKMKPTHNAQTKSKQILRKFAKIMAKTIE